MKWVLIIVAGIVGLVLLMALIGLMLPKGHRATRMARFRQPPEAVYAAITGPQDWRAGVTVTELATSGGPRRWREQSGRWGITFEEAAADPPRLYRSRIADQNAPFSGTWTWEIARAPDGCTCRITEEGQVSNPIFRFLSRFVIGQTKSIDAYLNALGRKFDQPVQIEP
jgi:hypothetical protein